MAMEIRKGTVADLENFIQLLHQVRETMEHKEWFYLDPPEVVRSQIRENIMELWVAEEDGHLAGVLSILHPGLSELNYGYDLEYEEAQLREVVCMDSAAVHPDYRGRGLQKLLLERAEQELGADGEKFLLCTIHPENSFSLNNALKQGYEIQKTLNKYGSVRHLLCKKISGKN